ncbi:hypothetical protein LSH36_151g04023 [Paralvinella palmiformis]|uniref:SWIM-type domain-containing protein n=1 Tax=Paralvinella palmiformis TaxID=53620 RepID=A0AAD9N724_9ANNE|nr:hypothetical protein LSH36_151g04023 [Paralvinella palmiformis]
MRNRRSLEDHNQFEPGWVKTVLYYKPIDSPHCIFKTDVTPPQRVNDTHYHPWIGLHEKDRVMTAGHCDCIARLGESCTHIATLLFQVEAASNFNKADEITDVVKDMDLDAVVITETWLTENC